MGMALRAPTESKPFSRTLDFRWEGTTSQSRVGYPGRLPGEDACAPHALLRLLAHITQDYLPRGSTIPSEVSPRISIINQENAI